MMCPVYRPASSILPSKIVQLRPFAKLIDKFVELVGFAAVLSARSLEDGCLIGQFQPRVAFHRKHTVFCLASQISPKSDARLDPCQDGLRFKAPDFENMEGFVKLRVYGPQPQDAVGG